MRDEMKSRIARDISERIAVFDIGADGERGFLPPFIDDREVARLEIEIKIAKAILATLRLKEVVGVPVSHPFFRLRCSSLTF